MTVSSWKESSLESFWWIAFLHWGLWFISIIQDVDGLQLIGHEL